MYPATDAVVLDVEVDLQRFSLLDTGVLFGTGDLKVDLRDVLIPFQLILGPRNRRAVRFDLVGPLFLLVFLLLSVGLLLGTILGLVGLGFVFSLLLIAADDSEHQGHPDHPR
ncbi:MAG: hypothetical protein ABEN55_05295 [Bradymonadaceae bacterium]